MYISKFQLSNYKSFLDSGELEFKPGINIIVGQNNSGKTALLESLSLSVINQPHTSIKTLPYPYSVLLNKYSSCRFSVTFKRPELYSILDRITPFMIPQAADNLLFPTEVNLFNEWLIKSDDIIFNFSISQESELQNSFYKENLSFNLYKISSLNGTAIKMEINNGFFSESGERIISPPIQDYLAWKLWQAIVSRIYRFFAERLNVGQAPFGSNQSLQQNASNLAEVLGVLILQNPEKANRLNKLTSIIFPHIKRITTKPLVSNLLEIRIWTIDPATEREDLSFPLSSCGTGVGQVLAILYVVLTAQEPQIIIIDEPQSFLHPGAAKKLVEILRTEFPEHQYIIATHSPTIIAAANPSVIIKLSYKDGETVCSEMNSKDIEEQSLLLKEIGVNLSDVFGADNILWVEGQTEEECFPLILENIGKTSLHGTLIRSVRETGNLEGKKFELVLKIYSNLSKGHSLFPPAIGFILDKEEQMEEEQDDLKKRAKNIVDFFDFLPRRMYENYLLHSQAIAFVINSENPDDNITPEEVEIFLLKKYEDRKYYSRNHIKESNYSPEWVKENINAIKENINAAKVLEYLFDELSDSRVAFKKTRHSVQITKWLIENDPDSLSEISNLLKKALSYQPKLNLPT
ncbi:MAG: AAA family ATPase [Microcoleus vaginatus WJT46-NPBG5]|jgi:AAA15 family ATPase/GTPase|nr:AAA family ATPase [Microcoleus vaginatus WJT46-NPBG5]